MSTTSRNLFLADSSEAQQPQSGNSPLRILGISSQDGESVVAIDMNIWGYGVCRESALENLQHQISVRFKYMQKNNKLRLTLNSAESCYVALYNQAVNESIVGSPEADFYWVHHIPLESVIELSGTGNICHSPDLRLAAMRCFQLPQVSVFSTSLPVSENTM